MENFILFFGWVKTIGNIDTYGKECLVLNQKNKIFLKVQNFYVVWGILVFPFQVE